MQSGSQRVRSRRLRAVVGVLVAGLGAGAMVLTTGERPLAQQRRPQGFIQGVVESASGPEAGVWVIAETNDLPTKFIKIVVTDDRGRYVLPELPSANYNVWVRGYGLADSKPVVGKPGQTVNLKAAVAASPAEAAKVYPANYWYSLLEPPAESEFPGTGPDGQRHPGDLQDPGAVHRSAEAGLPALPPAGQPNDARTGPHGQARVQVVARSLGLPGQDRPARRRDGRHDAPPRTARAQDVRRLDRSDCRRASCRRRPPRPKGVERNVVVTMWDWGTETSYMHDEMTTDQERIRA